MGYAYPWDFEGDAGAVPRLVASGVGAVAVAANYHATRVATPLHPAHRTVEVAQAACYVPVRPAAYADCGLVPAAPSWAAPDSFGVARAALADAGLPALAWTILTHNSALGRAHPDVTVRTAFGDRLRYALCPSAERVVAYARTLVTEIAEYASPDGFVFEACGSLGIEHGGEHDKLELGGWSPAQRALLSICFCAACAGQLRAAGADPEPLAAAIRAALREPGAYPAVDAGAAAVLVLGEGGAAALRAVRLGAAHRLLAAVAEAVPAGRVVLHCAADPWATGAFAEARELRAVDAVVANCWLPPEVSARNLAGLAALTDAAVGAYLRPDTAPELQPADLVARYRGAGASELHLYQLGSVGGALRDRLLALAAC